MPHAHARHLAAYATAPHCITLHYIHSVYICEPNKCYFQKKNGECSQQRTSAMQQMPPQRRMMPRALPKYFLVEHKRVVGANRRGEGGGLD
jgi:hypothetical protein